MLFVKFPKLPPKNAFFKRTEFDGNDEHHLSRFFVGKHPGTQNTRNRQYKRPRVHQSKSVENHRFRPKNHGIKRGFVSKWHAFNHQISYRSQRARHVRHGLESHQSLPFQKNDFENDVFW